MAAPSIDFHSHHSPQGAYLTFTCGAWGEGGGLRSASWEPPRDDLLIGWLDSHGEAHYLPFFRDVTQALEAFANHNDTGAPQRHALRVRLERALRASTDEWRCGPFRFTIATPRWPFPDPLLDPTGAAQALLPVVTVELAWESTDHTEPLTLLFGVATGRASQTLDARLPAGVGVTWDGIHGLATATPEAKSWVHVDAGRWLREGCSFHLGTACGVAVTLPPRTPGALQVVLGAFQPGPVTWGPEGHAAASHFHGSLAGVLAAGIERFDATMKLAGDQDEKLLGELASEERRFLVAHADRSYWGNSQLVRVGTAWRWLVYEGEYAMMNTLDLAVDHLFFELEHHPWAVRNLCDHFLDRYSYTDTLARPPAGARLDRTEVMELNPLALPRLVAPPKERQLPGGISFCHDMGVQGLFSEEGHSSYERAGLVGCFSHMTAEQVCNFTLCAVSYGLASGDSNWLRERTAALESCLESMLNRDDPVPSRRDGLVALDSERCGGGWEITTYDSLDPSLGQARGSLYLAVKYWAAWLGLEELFTRLGRAAAAKEAGAAARRVAATVVAAADPLTGLLPAILDGSSRAAILPAVEGLVFPWYWRLASALRRDGEFGPFIAVLERHLRAALDTQACRFPDGGWRLSSSAENSWLSKIAICQLVAEELFGLPVDTRADTAHARWQREGSRRWAFTDQIVHGEARGSRYYPRGVTNELWRIAAQRRAESPR